jgi:1-acyl-sn-glycerol-3-phosphate acyltransferase
MVTQTLARGPLAIWSASHGDMAAVEQHQVAWARAQLRAIRAQLDVHGAEHVQSGRPYVIIANHVSNLDPIALFAAVPTGMTYVAKNELLKVPIFGPIIRRTGAVFVDRGNSARAVQSMQAAADRVRAGQSVLVFPEGTRSRDAHLRPFKKGGFLLAQQSGVEILPVVLQGTSDLLPYGARVPRSGGRIRATILPPTPTTNVTVEALIATVQAQMTAVLQRA